MEWEGLGKEFETLRREFEALGKELEALFWNSRNVSSSPGDVPRGLGAGSTPGRVESPRMETSLRALGIDFGERRIGLAISDPAGRLAVPLAPRERRSDRVAIAQIAEIAAREGVLRLVVGEPVSVDGSRGEAVERVRRFGDKLALRTGLPLTFIGEALTTVEAHARLREAGVDPRREPGRLDALAAQILLQEALDQAARPEEPA
jgi:putative Holliday junction resolvase